ncbi:hypothetical protein GLOIN_2v1531010 [Rhizophagus clarus]|uniref:F-box domain-containing protein n=1 Tax=Rhizophagus clarus TaxID=94130 RepID=A0A8H3LTL2_9GLOM|nr:hypothetical protein GLOIN_2v1531010 [Rhizophagus clarus]
MFQLPVDCLNEIFEHLKEDQLTLYSCILVNRFWCEISMKFLWSDINNYNTSKFRTLIACLPIESKKILHDNGIIISTPTSKFPTFNYATFCKVLFINRVYHKIKKLLKNQQIISEQNLNDKTQIVVNEIFKMLMNQVTSLKSLIFFPKSNMTFTLYPGAQNCLKNLSELHCNSNVSTELFYQLSQICYNIQIFSIEFRRTISSGLADLISVQRNLKCFSMMLCYDVTDESLKNAIPSLLLKLPNNLMKLDLYESYHSLSLSFINNLLDLQELHLSFSFKCISVFEELQYVILPKLQVLKIRKNYPENNSLIKFLENNGKNLKEICIGEDIAYSNNSLNLSIAKLCSNLKKISVGIKSSEIETLKIIFNSCNNLESIKIWCGREYLSEKEALEAIVKFSRNIYELILYHQFKVQFKLLPEELESFFINWIDRKPQKPLSLVIVRYFNTKSLDAIDKNIEIINKYIKLGVIKKFKITDFDDDEYI